MFLVLVGCSNDKNTIEFWTPFAGDDGSFMEELVDAYNETDPDFKVKHVITPDIYTKIAAVLNSGSEIPDLTIIHTDRVPNYVEQNVLEPMTPIIDVQPEIKEENYIEEAWSSGIIDGIQYTIPLDIHGNIVYYNEDLLAKYNVEHFLDDDVVTFDEILSLEGKLDDGDYAVNDMFLFWVVLAQVQNFDGGIQTDENPTVNTPEIRKAIEKLKEIADAGLMTPQGEESQLMFQSGNVLFNTDGTWAVSSHEAVEDLNFGVTNSYAFDPDKFTNRASSHLFSMLKNDERSEEKVEGIGEFIEYIREHSIKWAEAGQIVASKEVLESPDYNQFMQSFFTSNEKQTESLYIYTDRYYPYVEEALLTYVDDIIHGEIDLDQGLEDMQKFVDDKVAEGTSNTN